MKARTRKYARYRGDNASATAGRILALHKHKLDSIGNVCSLPMKPATAERIARALHAAKRN